MKIRIGMGQMLVEGGAPDGNLRRALEMICRAAAEECEIIVLPECLDLGWTHPSARQAAQPVPGKHSDTLARAAQDAHVYVAAGLVERDGARLYNSAVLVSPAGDILLKHRKLNELTIAHDLYSCGASVAVTATPLGTIALNICADNFPTSLVFAHAQGRMGAQLLLSPSAWAVDADHDNGREPYGELWTRSYTMLAKLYDMTVVGVSNVGWLNAGPWEGRKCIGCSLAVGPGGVVLAQGPYGECAEALVPVNVELRPPIAAGTGFADALAARGYTGT